MNRIRYQVVVAGFGGQGIIFLVKLLSICSLNKGVECLGTENHGMSQRGGTVISDIKIGDFHTPMVNFGQADLLIGLHADEALRVIQFLKPAGTLIVNSGDDFPETGYTTVHRDVYELAEKGVFDIQALNVYMLGLTLKHVKDFPFTLDEIKAGIETINPKIAVPNLKILELGLN